MGVLVFIRDAGHPNHSKPVKGMVLVSQQPVHLCGRTLSWSRWQRPQGVEEGPRWACFRAVRPGGSADQIRRRWELVPWSYSAQAEAPILWTPDVKGWLIGKDPETGKDWGQGEKGVAEDEMVGWHHRLNRHEFEQIPEDSEKQGSLECCSLWGHKESDTTEQLNWTEHDKSSKQLSISSYNYFPLGMIMFKIYSLRTFQICNTVLLTIVTKLHIKHSLFHACIFSLYTHTYTHALIHTH